MAGIREYYEDYWKAPEAYDDPTTPQRQALLRKHLASLPKGSRILDVGCGRGEFCAFFQSLGLSPEGIDISTRAIEFARAHHPGIAFEAVEVQPYAQTRAATFDAAFSSEVIEHLFDVGDYLAAVNKLLKPGGIFVLTTPYHGLFKNIVLDMLAFSRHYDPLGQHIRFFDRKGLAMCLRRWGFEPAVWTGYGRPWPMYKSFFVVSRKAKDV